MSGEDMKAMWPQIRQQLEAAGVGGLPMEVVEITREGKFQINYEMSNGSKLAFLVVPEMASFIMEAWWTKVGEEFKPEETS